MFTFPLAPADLFEERRPQFMAWGIPSAVIHAVETRVTDMWADGPGGWTYEWAREAAKAKSREEWLLASSLFGAARFPCLATPSRVAALKEQSECFIKASPAFPRSFERSVIRCDSGHGTSVDVPVHIYGPNGNPALPTLLLSGGVDTGKMELHRMILMLSRLGKLRVVAMDMPGTGETDTPLRANADVIYKQVIDQFRGLGKIGFLGVSFGGHWAAKFALRHEMDAVVDLGGPVGVDGIDDAFVAGLPNGMPGIIGNAMRFDAYPVGAAAGAMLHDFSLRDQCLLTQSDCARTLVVNGSADPYIPAADIEVFRRYPSAEVWILQGLGHCAAEKLRRIFPAMATWLRKELHGPSIVNRLLHAAALKVLPTVSRL